MASELIYAFRVLRLPLLDAGGSPIGRIQDLVAIPGRPGTNGEPDTPPRIVGFVASSQRRRIFVNANRIAELNSDGARLQSWDIDLNPFKPRPGEVLINAELIDRKVGTETVSDIAMRRKSDGRSSWWEIDKVRLTAKNTLRRRSTYRLVDFEEVPALFDQPTEMQAEAARLRDFHPAEVAAFVRSLPNEQRRLIAEAMDDERLADVLEELTEAEQVRIVESLDRERLEGVFDEMDFDDLADLLGQMSEVKRQEMLEVMGKFLGIVHMQRLLREPPNREIGRMLDDVPIVAPDTSDRDVAERLASYDMLAVAVCDAAGRLLGAVTVDDVIDRMLGPAWRTRRKPSPTPEVSKS